MLDRRALISLGLLMAEAARRLVQIEHQLRQDLCSLQGFICALATAFGGAGNGLGLIVDCMHLRQLRLHALTQLAKADLHRFHFVLDARQGCGGFIGTRHAALRRFLELRMLLMLSRVCWRTLAKVVVISSVACAVRCARLRTSSATTAKPRPLSPARAASIAAFRASRLVCSAMAWIDIADVLNLFGLSIQCLQG